MNVINWIKKLFPKEVSINDIMEETTKREEESQEAAYARILDIVHHILTTLGLGENVKIVKCETTIQLTINGLSGLTRSINFNSAEELYSFVYGLHLAKDIFYVKPSPEKAHWAQEALLRPAEQTAYQNLQAAHKEMAAEFQTLVKQFRTLQADSLKNYNRRCVAENFVQVFRKHVRRVNNDLALFRVTVAGSKNSTTFTDANHVREIFEIIDNRLFEFVKQFDKDTKVELLSSKYLAERGETAEPAKAEAH